MKHVLLPDRLCTTDIPTMQRRRSRAPPRQGPVTWTFMVYQFGRRDEEDALRTGVRET